MSKDDLRKDPEFNAAAAAVAEAYKQGRVFSFAYASVLGAVQATLDALALQGLTPQDAMAQVHAAVIAVDAGLVQAAVRRLGVTGPQMLAHIETHQKIGGDVYDRDWKCVLSQSKGSIQLRGERVGLVGPDGSLIS